MSGVGSGPVRPRIGGQGGENKETEAQERQKRKIGSHEAIEILAQEKDISEDMLYYSH